MSYRVEASVDGRVVMVCGWGNSIEETITKAIESARYYVEEPSLSYVEARIQVFACCDSCDGTGRIAKRGRRALFGIEHCKKCKGEGSWVEPSVCAYILRRTPQGVCISPECAQEVK